MGLSDSPQGRRVGYVFPPGVGRSSLPPCRASQAPRLIFPRALSPTTPEGPASALACCFLTGVLRLHPARRTGRLHLANEAESGLLHYGSRVRRQSSRQLHYWNSRSFWLHAEQALHGELLSVHKISQAYPGTPRVSERSCSCSTSFLPVFQPNVT